MERSICYFGPRSIEYIIRFGRHLRNREVVRDFVEVCLFTPRKVGKVGIAIHAFSCVATLADGRFDGK